MTKRPLSTPSQRPLICPKGYGLCWTCAVHCDHPQANVINRREQVIEDDAERQFDSDFGHAMGLDYGD